MTINGNTDHTIDTAIVGLQTDDTLIVCNITFKKRELDELQKVGFLAKLI